MGAVLLMAFVGWGSLFTTVLRRVALDCWPFRAMAGLALLVWVGGWLNLCSWISPWVCHTLLIVGAGLAGGRWLLNKRRRGNSFRTEPDPLPHAEVVAWTGRLLALGASLLLTFHYAGYVWNLSLNAHDDLQAYLVFPEKMLQSGGMGADPFSMRRIVASLGGASFLQALVLSIGGHENMMLFDPGVGFLLLAGLVFAIGRAKGLSLKTLSLVLMGVLLLSFPQVNITNLGNQHVPVHHVVFSDVGARTGCAGVLVHVVGHYRNHLMLKEQLLGALRLGVDGLLLPPLVAGSGHAVMYGSGI